MQKDLWTNIFTYKQDIKLKRYVKNFGENWNEVAKKLKKFTPEECHKRYQQIKDIKIIKVMFTEEEDKLLEEKVEAHGKRWYIVVKFFSGKTQNDLKNRYYRHIRKQYEPNQKLDNNLQNTPTEYSFDDFQIDPEDFAAFEDSFVSLIM